MSTTVTSTATFGMDAFASLAVVPNSNTARGTITFTSAAPNSDRPSFTAKLQAKTFGPFLVPMSVSIVVEDGSCTYQLTGNAGGYSYDSSNNVTGLVGPDGATTLDFTDLRQSDGYHFHGFAPNQINSDLKFYDYSGALNDAAFQANLSAADAWATAGYLTIADPAGTSELHLVAIPALSFDWLGGDSLFIFWRGMATPEGGDMPIIGNTAGSSANGIKAVVTAAGKLKFNCYSAVGSLSRFGGTSSGTAFEAATAHSFAVAVDGVTGKHCYWVDGSRDSGYSAGFAAFTGGTQVDTVSSTTLKLAGDGSTSANVQVGVACKTQALVILSGRNGLGAPAAADLDTLVANLHRNPQKLVLASAW